jgi:PAS domain S-box-containing protein
MKTSLAQSSTECGPTTKVPHDHWWSCLFDLSEDAQVVCRENGTMVEANRKARQLLGLPGTGREFEWTGLFDLLTSNTAARLAELLGRALGRQETLPAVSLISEGHLSLLADLQITPLSGGYSLVSIKDASRRWRLESHVQRLMTAVDATSDVIFLTDSEFRIAFVNAAFQTETGYSIEEALGRPADFLRAPASQGCIQEYVDCVSQGRDWHGELCNVRSDGMSYPVEATISPIFERQGHFVGYVAFEKNVSARQRLQNELRLERNLVLSTINSLDAAVYTVDRQFRFNHINDGWKKMPAQHGWLDMTRQAGRIADPVRGGAGGRRSPGVVCSTTGRSLLVGQDCAVAARGGVAGIALRGDRPNPIS